MKWRPPRTDDAAWASLYANAYARLEERIALYEIPEPRWMPVQDVVVVYRLPNEYRQGGNLLYLPDVAEHKHDTPYSIGVLLCAGAEAMDVLTSHGVLPGDIVQFARFAGEEEVAARVDEAVNKAISVGATQAQLEQVATQARDAELKKKKLLQLKTPFIHGSFDQLHRLYGPERTMEFVRRVNKNGEVLHLIEPIRRE